MLSTTKQILKTQEIQIITTVTRKETETTTKLTKTSITGTVTLHLALVTIAPTTTPLDLLLTIDQTVTIDRTELRDLNPPTKFKSNSQRSKNHYKQVIIIAGSIATVTTVPTL